MNNDGLMMCLRDYIQGTDWFRLTSTCRSLREYAVWNVQLSCVYPYRKVVGKILNLPVGITHMEISCSVAAKGVKLPETVTHLVINFNNRVNNWKLPKNLVSLTLGDCFDKAVESWVLPDSLKELYIGRQFSHPVRRWILPPRLVRLDFSNACKVSIAGWALPQTLEYLKGWCDFECQYTVWRLPRNLKTFIMRGSYMNMDQIELPECLEKFAVSSHVDFFEKHHLPKSLKLFCVNGCLSIYRENLSLPSGLKIFSVIDIMQKHLGKIGFPNGLECLVIGGDLPRKMSTLIDGDILQVWRHSVSYSDPNQIQLDDLEIPDSVSYIAFPSSFTKDLRELRVPEKLKEVRIGTAMHTPPFRQ